MNPPDRARMIDRLERLIAANSENPPGRELEAARLLVHELTAIGLTAELHQIAEGRANVVARLQNGPGPVFAFNSHMDVVPAGSGWSSDPFRLACRGERLVARGACDAKGPIVAMLEAIEMLASARERWSGKLLAVFVADEEVASRGARAYVAENPRIDFCIVGEPTSNKVVIAHKGSMRPLIRVKGVPAHSASPDQGVNAIYKAAALLAMIERAHRDLVLRSHPLLGPASLTVTRCHGGHADNVVPEACELLLDRRTVPGEGEDEVRAQFAALVEEARAAHGIDAEIVEYRPTTGGATEIDPEAPIVAAARAAVRRHGIADDGLHGLQGACDLVHFRSIAAQGVVLGPGSLEVAHKPDEFVDEDEFVQASLIYCDTAQEMLQREGAIR